MQDTTNLRSDRRVSMENLIETLLADESQRLFVLGISAVVLLSITLIIVASVSRVRFFKHLFHDIKQINKEKDKEIEKLRREKQAIRTKNKLLEDKLSLFDTTKMELDGQMSIIATMQDRVDTLEENQREKEQIVQTKTKECQDIQYKFRGLQKRNEVLVEENSMFRSDNKNFHLKTKELESIVLTKFVANKSDIELAEIEKIAIDIFTKNKNFFDNIKNQAHYRDLSPLLQDILEQQRDLSNEYEKRISKDMDLVDAIISNIELHRRVKLEESIIFKKFKEQKKLNELTKEVAKNIIKVAQVGKKHIKMAEDESSMLNVSLPYDHNICLDIGLSLESYGLYVDAEKAMDRDRLLKNYLKTFTTYIERLIEKSSENSDQFVILLIPHRDAMDLLFKHKISLCDQAYKKGILITTSTQLLTLLQSTARLWGYFYNIGRVASLELSTEKLEDEILRITTEINSVAQNLEMMQETLAPSNIIQNEEKQ